MPKTRPIPCTREEMDALMTAASDNDFYHLVFYIAKTTGRRLGEYWNVKVKDIDFQRKVMMTLVLKRRQYVEKEALLNDDACRLLSQYIKRYNLKLEDYIFRQSNNTKTYRGIQNAVVAYAKKAGIKHKFSFHNFRHYFITELIRRGFSHNEIMKLTGHSSIGVIATYDHTVASDIRDKAISAINNL